ncbi:MAG: bile acid:sodium symporter family protein [Bacteroidia bacterium]
MMTELTDTLIVCVLAFIMLSIGMSLTIKAFKEILAKPSALILALFLQMILIPLLSFALIHLFDLPPTWKVGFMILAICPGGPTASFINHLFKANVALSIALTSINSLLTLISIPLITNYSLQYFMGTSTQFHLPFWNTFQEIFVITLIPATAGILIRIWQEEFADRWQNRLKSISAGLLGLVFLIKIFAGEKQGGTSLTMMDTLQLLPSSLILNALGLIFGYYCFRLFRFNKKDALSVSTELAIHNTTLAFLITATFLRNAEMTKPALIYSLFSFWTAFGFAWLVTREKT